MRIDDHKLYYINCTGADTGPVTGWTVRRMLDTIEDATGVRPDLVSPSECAERSSYNGPVAIIEPVDLKDE